MKLHISILLLLALTQLGAQTQGDSIYQKKVLGETVFYQNDTRLKPTAMLNIMKPYPEAYNEMKRARSNHYAANFFGFIGGAFIGFPLGSAIAGGDANWVLAAIGTGILGIGIPFSIIYSKRAKKAVELYHQKLSYNKSHNTSIHFKASATGIGICVSF